LRDRRCVISGTEAVGADVGFWTGFGAAHVFPLAYEGHWIAHNYSRWITIPPEKGESIHSVQNGMLLRSDVHQLFDSYALSINPDVCIPYIFFKGILADSYLRTITRSYSSPPIRIISLANILIRGFWMTLNDLLISSCVGISDRQS
jgi:hypothetical protein